jgi:hypothetical protein
MIKSLPLIPDASINLEEIMSPLELPTDLNEVLTAYSTSGSPTIGIVFFIAFLLLGLSGANS